MIAIVSLFFFRLPLLVTINLLMRFECMMKLMRQTTTARRSLHHDDKHGLLQLQAKKPISLLLGVDHDALYATYPVV